LRYLVEIWYADRFDVDGGSDDDIDGSGGDDDGVNGGFANGVGGGSDDDDDDRHHHHTRNYLYITLIYSKITFSPGNFVRYLKASSCYSVISCELQADRVSEEVEHLRNICPTVVDLTISRICPYLHKSQRN